MVSMNFEGLKDSVVELLAGNEVRVDVGRFANDMHVVNSRDGVLTLLIHLGYLSYNREKRTCRIPNQEVRQEFESTVQETGWEFFAEAVRNSEQLLEDTLAGNAEAVAAAIEKLHDDRTAVLQYNNENALSYLVQAAYESALRFYTFKRELPMGKGFADLVMVPRRHVHKPAIVVELKFDKSVRAAISQIKEKGYAESLKEYAGEVVLVGINYDKKTKKHECIIERIGKTGKAENGQSEKRAKQIAEARMLVERVMAGGVKLNKRQQAIVEWIAGHPKTTYDEMAEHFRVSRQTIYTDTKKLQDSQVVIRDGEDKNGLWKLNDK